MVDDELAWALKRWCRLGTALMGESRRLMVHRARADDRPAPAVDEVRQLRELRELREQCEKAMLECLRLRDADSGRSC